MSAVATAVRARRSIKYFDPAFEMPESDVRELLELARLSPTAFNIQHWRFVRVIDPATRRAIRDAAWDQPQMTDASILLVLCYDTLAWQRDPARYWRDAPPEVAEQLIPEITGFYQTDATLQRDEGVRSCSIAAQTLMLAAQDMGYASCPLDGFDFDTVGTLINLPADHEIALILTIGKPLTPPHARPGSLPFDDVVMTDRFPDSAHSAD